MLKYTVSSSPELLSVWWKGGDWKWAEEITSAAEKPMDHVCVSLQDL
jgi:hypothetical protein